jgi:tetratricopeptide (TPR) repeat protein
MPIVTADGIRYSDERERLLGFNLHDPAIREPLRAALCGEPLPAADGTPRPFERVIELRGASHSGKTYLLQAAALAAAEQGHGLVHAMLDIDASNPDGVALGAYADKLLTQLRQGRTPRQQRRARLLESLLQDAVVNVELQPTGWDQLAWLPLAIGLELPLARLRELFRRHLPPDQSRPPPERFIETLHEITAQLGRERGAGLLLQVPEQRQPDAGVRDLLLEALPTLPRLVLAFTLSDAGAERDYLDHTPLRLWLQPMLPGDLAGRIRAGLGEHALPKPLLDAIARQAQGSPGLAAAVLADLVGRGLVARGGDGLWHLDPADEAAAELDRLLGRGLFHGLTARIEHARARQGAEAALDLRGFLDHACLCGRNVPFGPIAELLGLDAERADRLLDLIDEHLADPRPLGPDDAGDPAAAAAAPSAQPAAEPAAEPWLDHLAYHHPDFPDHEVFRFRNPLLARHLLNRLGRPRRLAAAEGLLAVLAQALPPRNRGIAELHLAVLEHAGDDTRRRALEGELYYWLDAAHARAIRRQLTADLRARRVVPEVVWEQIERNWRFWSVARRRAWLDAYGDQPQGVPVGMRLPFLDRLTWVLLDGGDLDEALEVSAEAVAFGREHLDGRDPNLAALLGNRAGVLHALGRLEEALAALDEARRIECAALPAGHPNIARSLNKRGVVLHALGRGTEALAALDEGLLIQRAALPAGHLDIAGSLNNRGLVLEAAGRLDEALAAHDEALLVARAALPAGHPNIAQSLNNCALVLFGLGRLDEALVAHDEALLIRRTALPARHPDIARSLNNRGLLLHVLGRGEEALAALDEALLIQRAVLPAGHPDIATSLHNRALVLDALGRREEARAAHDEALLIRRAALPAGHLHIAQSLNTRGSVLHALGRREEALADLEEALSIYRAALPPGHPWIAEAEANLQSARGDDGLRTDAGA